VSGQSFFLKIKKNRGHFFASFMPAIDTVIIPSHRRNKPMSTKVLFSPKEVQLSLGIGHDKFWKLVKAGALTVRKLGRSSKVHVDDLQLYINSLPIVNRRGTEIPKPE
jgi:hypothetical protein